MDETRYATFQAADAERPSAQIRFIFHTTNWFACTFAVVRQMVLPVCYDKKKNSMNSTSMPSPLLSVVAQKFACYSQ